jgi:hypothetical protein
MRGACPAHLILFDLIILITFGDERNLRELSLYNFLQPPMISCPLAPSILFSTLFSNASKLCPSLNVRDQVLHSHKITGKSIVLYILILTLLDSRREDKSS